MSKINYQEGAIVSVEIAEVNAEKELAIARIGRHGAGLLCIDDPEGKLTKGDRPNVRITKIKGDESWGEIHRT